MKKYIKLLPILIFVFTAGFIGYSFTTVDAGENGTIPDTVYIGDIDVSGMTKEEAEDALDAYVNTLQNTTFTLSAGTKNIQVSAEDLGV